MKKISKYTTISIEKSVLAVLRDHRRLFENHYGGRWSLSDTIREYQDKQGRK